MEFKYKKIKNIGIINNNLFYIYPFKSFNEIKETLDYLEKIYLKHKNFLSLKISNRKKRNVVYHLRLHLSNSILNYISNNYISNNDLLFINQFYLKYFLLSDKEIYPQYSSLFSFFIGLINQDHYDNHKPDDFYTIEKFHILSISMKNYFNRFYYFLCLIILLDNKLLIDNFLFYFPINSNFYYYFIEIYITRYYEYFDIKNSHFFYIILLNLDQEKLKKMNFREEHYKILYDLIKFAEEKQNLKINLENF